MDRTIATSYAEVLTAELETIVNQQDAVLQIPLERSITENETTVRGIMEFCELTGVLDESFAAVMFYLEYYKDTEKWPLDKSISVPDWGRSDKVLNNAEFQRPVDPHLRAVGG